MTSTYIQLKVNVFFVAALALFMAACAHTEAVETPAQPVQRSKEFNDYWHRGEAEVSSYRLEQARYGELRQGEAVLVFVTEPFSKEKQVKADNPGKDDYQVLKLNMEKKFPTGIYPYSMLNSSFVPIHDAQAHAAKITATVQEWCGHAFLQINNRNGQFRVESRSYFESEGDQNYTLKSSWLEDELWAKIRLDPKLLPTGEQEAVPGLFYIRLLHKELKPYKAVFTKKDLGDGTSAYSIRYPELDRELTIRYSNDFPHLIEGWEETYVDGWGGNAQKLTSKAAKIKSLKLAYWSKNSNADAHYRQELGLGNGN